MDINVCRFDLQHHATGVGGFPFQKSPSWPVSQFYQPIKSQMDPILALGLCAIAFLIGYVAGKSVANKQDDSADEADHTVGEHLDSVDDRIDAVEHEVFHPHGKVFRLENLAEQVNHLAKVQLLILKQLNVEHQILPQRDVLAPLESFADSKKAKERSA